MTECSENQKFLAHSLKVSKWIKPDMKNPNEVTERIKAYFNTCAEDNVRPSVAGMAMAFDVDRRTIWKWRNGIDCMYLPEKSRAAIDKAYYTLNTLMETYMQDGKINPVAGIFLMKNHMGYQDKQEVVLTPNNQLGEQTPPEELQQKYLEATTYKGDSENA